MIKRKLIARSFISFALLVTLSSCITSDVTKNISPTRVEILELNVGNRISQVWHWSVPTSNEHKGTILFSHGAGSAPWKYTKLLNTWISAGYQIYAPLHVDSNDHPNKEDYPGLLNWTARLEDMHVLSSKYGTKRYIAAGHSYGALTALTLGGASPLHPKEFKGEMADSNAIVVIAFSPPGPIPSFVTEESYADLAVPAFIQTGTKDIAPGTSTYEGHLTPFNIAASGSNVYGLTIEGVDHYFGNAICQPEIKAAPQLQELELAANLSLQFLDIHFLNKPDAESMNMLHNSDNSTTYTLEIK